MTIDPDIIEHYAYATDDIEILTVEARHPELTSETGDVGVIRIAAAFVAPSELETSPYFEAKLEADAPLGADQIVKFIRGPIEIVRPARESSAVPRARFRFANVDPAISEALLIAASGDVPIEISLRVFTDKTRLAGQPEVLDGFELVDPQIDTLRVEVAAQPPDVINTPFHRQFYDQRFPLLGL